MTSFQTLPLHQQLFKSLELLGFDEATEVQAQAIPPALEGKDVMVSAKTGSGKTAAFILPMLDRMLNKDTPNSGTRGLILLPTRELALQTRKMFQELAKFTQIKCGLVIGGEPYKHQIATLRRNPEVIIATPGRLVEHIEKRSVDFDDLEFLVMDEADRMLDMGFSEDMQKIASVCNTERQNFLFSATLKHQGISNILGILKNPVSLQIDSYRQNHSEIVQQIVLADDTNHKYKLVTAIVAEEQASKVFVFCKTRVQCETVGKHLGGMKLKVGFIHGEIAQSDRKQVMNRFRDNKVQVLVATDVAARGLDIADVDLVINFTVAQSGDDHVHRVGRTGRAGKAGKAVTLVDAIEWNKMSSIERYLKIRFEHRVIEGLKANYTGPKLLKKSGKAAGTKKKPTREGTAKKKAVDKKATRKRNIVNKGKRTPAATTENAGKVQDRRFGPDTAVAGVWKKRQREDT